MTINSRKNRLSLRKKDRQEKSSELSRRAFISAAVGSFGALAMSGFPTPIFAQRGGGSVTRYPLYKPPVISSELGILNYSLDARSSVVDLGGGKLSNALTYNGFLPGPTFQVGRGDYASIILANGLTKETTVHWHGMIVPTSADGHPRDAVMPNQSYAYQYLIDQRACLNWYHPHPHMLTGEQVCLGLAGAFIIRDDEEAALGLPSGAYEVPLIIRDTNFDKRGNILYNPRNAGYDGNTPLVNGTRSPKLDVDKAVYRFRVLNGANARIFKLALNNGAGFYVIGNDGGLLENAATVSEIEFGGGERLDILVDFRALARGAKVMLRDLNAGWDLLEFNCTGNNPGQGAGSIPTGQLSFIPPLSNPARTRNFSFDGMSRINGLEYDINRIDFQVPFGETELWRFTTGGNAPHPVHVHGASFQVQSRSGGRGVLYPWERGWKDTVLLLDRETVEVLIRFDGYRGLYLMHCHKLEHEDMGMMMNFVVN
jgi:FtsP/CotA-like multicopper oxidase with cupredoxin domain